MKVIEIYTDGSHKNDCSISSCIILKENSLFAKEVSLVRGGTNNFAELRSVEIALKIVRKHRLCSENIHLYTDSQLVYNTFTKWIDAWEERGFKKSSGKPVANVSLIKSIKDLMKSCTIHFHWVRSHNGNKWNEEADKLCNHLI